MHHKHQTDGYNLAKYKVLKYLNELQNKGHYILVLPDLQLNPEGLKVSDIPLADLYAWVKVYGYDIKPDTSVNTYQWIIS